MIGQYLSNTNEIDTIYILQNILQLNKALLLFMELLQVRRPAGGVVDEEEHDMSASLSLSLSSGFGCYYYYTCTFTGCKVIIRPYLVLLVVVGNKVLASTRLQEERDWLSTFYSVYKTVTLFRCKKFLNFDTVAFLFLFDKNCLIME